MLSTQALLSRILAALGGDISIPGAKSRVNATVFSTIETNESSPLALSVPIPETLSPEGKYCVLFENTGNGKVEVDLQIGTLFGDSGNMSWMSLTSKFEVEPNESVVVPVNSWLIGDGSRIVLTSSSDISANIEVRTL